MAASTGLFCRRAVEEMDRMAGAVAVEVDLKNGTKRIADIVMEIESIDRWRMIQYGRFNRCLK